MPEKHPPYPNNGEHLFSRWMPYDKFHEYRVCLHPDCHDYEKREANG